MRTWIAVAALLLAPICCGAAAPLSPVARVALVIGNGDYLGDQRNKLSNARRDAMAIAAELEKLGFEVVPGTFDLSRSKMLQALDDFERRLKGRPAIGLVYFAGHGFQLDGRNYLAPTDMVLETEAQIPARTIAIDFILARMQAAGSLLNILMLDACRDNPFGSIVSRRGLAPPYRRTATNTLIAYATQPGNTASDGAGGHSPYAAAFLEELRSGGRNRIEDAFKIVRVSVQIETRNRQQPWEETSLEVDFRFDKGELVRARRPTPQELNAQLESEAQGYAAIRRSTDPIDFLRYMKAHPDGVYFEAAQARVVELSPPTLAATRQESEWTGWFAPPPIEVGDEFQERVTVDSDLWKPADRLGSGAQQIVELNLVAERFDDGIVTLTPRRAVLQVGTTPRRTSIAGKSFQHTSELISYSKPFKE